jgi:NitT/TauT family transport system permease protein
VKQSLAQLRRVVLTVIAVRTPLSRGLHASIVVFGFILCVGFYFWLSTRPGTNATFIPPLSRLWEATRLVFSGDDLWLDVRASFGRVTAGFLLAAMVGIPVGIMIGAFRSAEALTQPVLEFLRYVPVPALIPIMMITFGIGESAKIALIFVGTFFQLCLMTADEVRRVPHELVQAAQTLGARRNEVVVLVLLRSAMPGIFDALRLCNGWAWTYVVVAELVAATEGLGFRTLRFYRFIQTPQIFVYLAVLGAIGLALDLFFRSCHARLFRWADATRR